MTAIVKSRLVFLDSDSVVTNGIGTDFRVSFPSGQITAGDGQFLRVSLQNFSMLKNFYNINENNNTVACRTQATPVYAPVSIPTKDYAEYYDIVEAFGTALATYFQGNQTAGGTYTLDTATIQPASGINSASTTDRVMEFTINSSTAHGMAVGDTTIQCRDFDTSDVTNEQMDFSDSYEILYAEKFFTTDKLEEYRLYPSFICEEAKVALGPDT